MNRGIEMLGRTFTVILLGASLTACGSNSKEMSLKSGDKRLNCSEVMLEINEAEFKRQKAENQQSPGFKSLVMPISYISTYVEAGDKIQDANSRVDYLNRIYEILDCDKAPTPRSIANHGSQIQQPMQYAPMVMPVSANYSHNIIGASGGGAESYHVSAVYPAPYVELYNQKDTMPDYDIYGRVDW